jgi:tripartite-type tricarboxylate transporter receptor subunit TctC
MAIMSHSQAACGFASLNAAAGIVAPAGIPSAVRAKLVAALACARQTPAMKQRIEFLNYEPIYDDPAQFAATVRSEIEEYSAIAKHARSESRAPRGR